MMEEKVLLPKNELREITKNHLWDIIVSEIYRSSQRGTFEFIWYKGSINNEEAEAETIEKLQLLGYDISEKENYPTEEIAQGQTAVVVSWS